MFAGVIAAVNASTDQTWKGYAVAAVTFLLRFVVTGPSTAAALQQQLTALAATAPAAATVASTTTTGQPTTP